MYLNFVFKDIDEGANVRKNFHGKLIASPKCLFGLSAHTNTSRGTSDDNSSRGQCRSLGEEAHNYENSEDKVAIWTSQLLKLHDGYMNCTHLIPQS